MTPPAPRLRPFGDVPAARSENMRRIRSSDTTPERRVRALLRQLGVRGYRLHADHLPGRPDVVVPRAGLAIFVHGCFWHRHAACRTGRRGPPKTNPDYWLAKFARNIRRDRRARRELNRLGWRVLVVWECRLRDEARVAARLGRAIGGGATARGA